MGKEATRNVGNRGPLGAAVAANEADAFVQLRAELWHAFGAPEIDCESLDADTIIRRNA